LSHHADLKNNLFALDVPRPEESTVAAGRIIQLDGLRAVAILMVLLNHAGRMPLGWAGVDVFFVLSGFLITGILMDRDELYPSSTWRFYGAFYGRRFFRILPAYALTLLVSHLIDPSADPHPWPFFVFFGMNFAPFFHGGSGDALPLWSLAVEEQFYLVWPTIVRHVSRTTLWRIAVGSLIIVPILRVAATPFVHNEFAIYILTPFRCDLLCAGAALTLIWQSRTPSMEDMLSRLSPVMCLASFGLLGALQAFPYFRLSSNKPIANGLCLSLSLAGAVSLLAWALVGRGFLFRFLTLSPMRYIGRISYTFYLIHVIAIFFVERFLPYRYILVPVFLVATAYATISWYLIERPMLRLGSLIMSRFDK
jgi:peptidoglycan/LPS O-acetylase OafA/YrhL